MGKQFQLIDPSARMNLAGGRVITGADLLDQEDYDSVVSRQEMVDNKPQRVVVPGLASQFKEVTPPEEKKSKGQAQA